MKRTIIPIILALIVLSSCKDDELIQPTNLLRLYDGQDGQSLELVISIPSDLQENVPLNLDTRGADNTKSSVRWDLAPGVQIILYADKNGTGAQLPLEGSGFKNLSEFGLDRRVSSVKFVYL